MSSLPGIGFSKPEAPRPEGLAWREMTKAPTKAQREAQKAFRQVAANKAMTEHETAQKAFSDNRERLKAERLVREASPAPHFEREASKAKRK